MATIALQSAASGLSALNTQLDVIANNLANVNTPGFKSSRANFEDLLYVEKSQPGVLSATGEERPIGLYVGLGTRISGTQLNFREGSPQDTGRALDLNIKGEGFFQVRVQDAIGEGFAYTRAGNFTLNSDGNLVLASDTGRVLQPEVQIPPNATEITIDSTGVVQVRVPGNQAPINVGQLQIATFPNPGGLQPIGENLYVDTVASGNAVLGNPGAENRGQLQQGLLEGSNVDPTFELIELIRTQRAFEMNSNTIRTADSALQTVTNIKR